MKFNFLYIILAAFLVVFAFWLYAQVDHTYKTLESQIGSHTERLEVLEIPPQTGEDEEKIKLRTQLADANTKLINADFDKMKLELKESNQQWLWEWTAFLGVMFAVFGLALWFVVKSLIADKVEKHLKGFQESVEQVKKQQERIRIIERDYAAQILAAPDEISESGEYIYAETVRSLSEQTILDVIHHTAFSIYVRIRAAEILKKRNPEQSLSVLLEMVNSFLDTDVIKDEDIDTMWHLRDLVPLFKDIHDEKTFRGLSKLLARVLKLKEDTDIRKAQLYWIVFSLSYVGDALNTDKVIPKMRDALPNLFVSDKEDSNNLENLANYFNKFQEYEVIKEILTSGLTENMPDVEEHCLKLLPEEYSDFVKDWKENTNKDNEKTNESEPTN